jgi:hypothetical protein
MFAYTKLMQAMAAAGVVSATDPYFNLTTLLLNTSSTNGAQNNTFLDSSTNNFTITRNGNTTQGTFTPFSQTGWSNYFDGTDDDLSISSSASLTPASGDFTLECWIYPTSWGGSGTYRAITAGPVSGCMFFGQTSTNFGLRSLAVADVVVTSTLPTVNTWTHVAVSRSGTTARLFINGALAATATDSTNFPQTQFVIGNTSVGGSEEYSGYISNLRFVKGTAVYTSAFTPSTTPLTAISNTQLLTCQSNRFVDNSSNAFALSIGGTPSVQAFSPFAPTAAYDAAVVGGSGYFSSSSDYLTTTGTALGSGAFTIELWIYPTSVPNSQNAIYSNGTSDSAATCVFSILSGRTLSFYSNGIAATSTATVPLNAWSHIAAVRSGTTLTVYLNGVSVATATISNDITSTAVQIGHGYGGILNTFLGYYSGLRTLVGTALYTTTFTPPTAPPTAITNTSLLTNFTNSGIYDSTAKNVLETVGNAQVSTTQAKWGTTSMYFDGSGDNLAFPKNELFNFGTGDFTIEFWFYPPSVSYGAIMYSTNNGSKTDTFAIYSYGSGQSPANSIVALVTASGGGAWSLFNNQLIGATTAATWQHVALVRNGSTFKGYMNGVAGFTVTSSSAIASFNGFSIASNGASGDYLTGYIDDLRITRYARYTADFTPPTAAFLLL